MAFISDHSTLRTWDPDTGWELFEVPGHMGAFSLRHPKETTIEFWGTIISVEPIENESPGARPQFHTVREIKAVNERPGAKATDVERRLIEASLHAFGVLHNGPRGTIEVRYAD